MPSMLDLPYLTDDEKRLYCGCGSTTGICFRLDSVLELLSKERAEKAAMSLELHRLDEQVMRLLAKSGSPT